MEVLINHPKFGSLWLEHCEIKKGEDGKEYVIGETWDITEMGNPNLPMDYVGEYITLNFPVSCIRKRR